MRIIHTADWHLGRQFHGHSLIDDQAYTLDELYRVVGESAADVLIIAGDVFDRRQPPDSAVSLLSDVLTRIILDHKTRILVIAGNHDSARRLEFGAPLLSDGGLFIRGAANADLRPIRLDDEHGVVEFCLIPYEQGEPIAARASTGDAGIASFDDALAHAVNAFKARCRAPRRVAVAHCFTAGADVSDSERPLRVGGSDQVTTRHFEGFQYTALGHLHRPQRVSDRAVYSGSLLKYSFSEAQHKKSIELIELAADGTIACESIALDARRDVRVVEGSLEALLTGVDPHSPDDYILARLTDTGALFDPLVKLRSRYPNITHLERPNLFPSVSDANAQARARLKRTDVELFDDFYRAVTDQSMNDKERAAFVSCLEQSESGDAP